VEIGFGSNSINVIIDTGFNGEFMLPVDLINDLGYEQTMMIKAELADGSIMDTLVYSANIDWFGTEKEVEVMGTESSDALLGTEMLRGTTLFLNLDENIVELESGFASKLESFIVRVDSGPKTLPE